MGWDGRTSKKDTQAGRTTFTDAEITAGVTASKTVTFDVTFDQNPSVVVTAGSTTAPEGTHVSVSNVNTTGFDLYVHRDTLGTGLTVMWQAQAVTQ